MWVVQSQEKVVSKWRKQNICFFIGLGIFWFFIIRWKFTIKFKLILFTVSKILHAFSEFSRYSKLWNLKGVLSSSCHIYQTNIFHIFYQLYCEKLLLPLREKHMRRLCRRQKFINPAVTCLFKGKTGALQQVVKSIQNLYRTPKLTLITSFCCLYC